MLDLPMVDRLTSRERSALMARIGPRDTKPELIVRRLLHVAGYRYRLHAANLPGRPDIVFPGRRAVIFVHGCFWHRHDGCRLATTPGTRVDFWTAKFEANRKRDQRATEQLNAAGWSALIIWQCETSRLDLLLSKLQQFLGKAARKVELNRRSRL